jgi:cytochrome c553
MIDRRKPYRDLQGWCLGVAVGLVQAPAAAQGDRALGEYLSSECVTCHQISGREQPGIPSITGIPETRIIEALNEYKSKKRSNPVMQSVAGKFSNDEIAALATFFGSLKSRR